MQETCYFKVWLLEACCIDSYKICTHNRDYYCSTTEWPCDLPQLGLKNLYQLIRGRNYVYGPFSGSIPNGFYGEENEQYKSLVCPSWKWRSRIIQIRSVSIRSIPLSPLETDGIVKDGISHLDSPHFAGSVNSFLWITLLKQSVNSSN